MNALHLILDWIAAVSWPASILTIALIYRKPIYSLLEHLGGIAGRAVTQPFKLSLGSFKVNFEEAVAAKNPKNMTEAITAAADLAESFIPYAVPVPGQRGLFTSPYAPYSGYIDARGFPPGTQLKDPYTGKIVLLPENNI